MKKNNLILILIFSIVVVTATEDLDYKDYKEDHLQPNNRDDFQIVDVKDCKECKLSRDQCASRTCRSSVRSLPLRLYGSAALQHNKNFRNVVVSPTNALRAILNLHCMGKLNVSKEIERRLGYSDMFCLHNHLDTGFGQRRSFGPNDTIVLGNAVFSGCDLQLKCNTDSIRVEYDNPRQTVNRINTWQHTVLGNKAINPVPQSEIRFGRRCAILPADIMYANLKDWVYPFYHSPKGLYPFHFKHDEIGLSKITWSYGLFRYLDLPKRGYKLIELPIKGGEIKVLIVLPYHGYDVKTVFNILQESSTENFNSCAGMLQNAPYKNMSISLPLFKVQTRFYLGETIHNQVIDRRVSEPGDNFRLSGCETQNCLREYLQLNTVQIHWNEVCHGDDGKTDLRGPWPAMVVDRPFIYAIHYQSRNCKDCGYIVAAGHIQDPNRQ